MEDGRLGQGVRETCTSQGAARAPPSQPTHAAHLTLIFLLSLLQEREFEVYEPFCANYLQALDLATAETANLQVRLAGSRFVFAPVADLPSSRSQGRSDLDLILEPTRELPAFLIKPIQRITKYPLLLSVSVFLRSLCVFGRL